MIDSTYRTIPGPLPLSRLNISANHAGIVARELLSRGVDVQPIFSDLGMDLPQANRPARRISVEAFVGLMRLAIKKTDDPAVVFKAFQNIQPGDLDALGFAVSCSSTYLSLLQRFQRFSKYILSDGVIQIIEERDEYLFLADIEDSTKTGNEKPTSQKKTAGTQLSRVTLEYQDLLLLLESFGMGLITLSNSICAEQVVPTKVYTPFNSHPAVRCLMEENYPDTEFLSAPFFGLKFSKAFANKV